MVRARRSRNQRTGPGRKRAKAARLGSVRPGPDNGPRRRSVKMAVGLQRAPLRSAHGSGRRDRRLRSEFEPGVWVLPRFHAKMSALSWCAGIVRRRSTRPLRSMRWSLRWIGTPMTPACSGPQHRSIKRTFFGRPIRCRGINTSGPGSVRKQVGQRFLASLRCRIMTIGP